MPDNKREHDSAWDEAGEAVRHVQRLVHRFVNELSREVGDGATAAWSFTAVNRSADIVEEDDRLRVLVDLPGVAEEDIELSLVGTKLILEGERRPPVPAAETRRQEAPYGRFKREIALPCEVAEDGIEATLSQGVLEVILPRRAKKSGIRINLKKQ